MDDEGLDDFRSAIAVHVRHAPRRLQVTAVEIQYPARAGLRRDRPGVLLTLTQIFEEPLRYSLGAVIVSLLTLIPALATLIYIEGLKRPFRTGLSRAYSPYRCSQHATCTQAYQSICIGNNCRD